jgi:hypothetical protein
VRNKSTPRSSSACAVINARLLLLCSALTLTACASWAPPSTTAPPPPPPDLAQMCPPLARPADGTAAALLTWGVETARAYNQCAARHRALVEAWPR